MMHPHTGDADAYKSSATHHYAAQLDHTYHHDLSCTQTYRVAYLAKLRVLRVQEGKYAFIDKGLRLGGYLRLECCADGAHVHSNTCSVPQGTQRSLHPHALGIGV
jgi:hypothetical protein